jgi:hypothetical protein
MPRHLRIACFVLCLIGALPGALHAQGTEIVRGRVTDAEHKPLADATVTITGLATQAVLTARTTEKGVFTALFPNPEGDYLISIRKIGYAPFNTRVVHTGLTNVLIVDATLKTVPFMLDTLVVADQRGIPKGDVSSIGGLEQNLLAGAIFSLDPSDLIALASQVPGILGVGDSAFSVLGASAGQNNGTLDGAKFNGRNLPPDAIASSKVITTSADPKNAGFAGGQTATFLRGGSDIFALTGRANLSDNHLAWADPNWSTPIPRIGTTSGGVGGPIIKKKLHYQVSWSVSDNASDIYSLLDPPTSLLSLYGLSLDTVNAVSNTLHQLGVPLFAGNVPTSRDSRSYNTTTVIDFTPTAITQLRLTHTGFWQNSASPGVAPSTYPTTGAQSTNTFQFLSAKLSHYFHGFLDELGTSLNYSHFASMPFVDLPGASVRIGTAFDDGRTGLTSLRFGGGSGNSQNSSYDLDTQNELSWFTPNSRHHLKIGQDIDFGWGNNFAAGNQFGSYSYQTLADLEANHPASYSLTLSSFPRSTHGSTAAAWIGDEWTASQALQLQGGVRLDAAFPGTVPGYNPDVAAVFGLHTDQVPHTSFITPRVGFSWTSDARRGKVPTPNPLSAVGTLPAGMTPDVLRLMLGTPVGSAQPGIAISGSVGGYGGTLSNDRIAGLVDQTGLPNTRRTLTCVGGATPIPNWNAVDATPTSCLDGTAPTAFSTNQPTVQVYDPTFQVPITWRANLGIDGIRLPHKWTIAILGLYSHGTNAQSALDENLRTTPGFTLANEANRPVYAASATDIVPETGTIAPGAYRINPNYGSVTDVISDLHYTTEQMQASLAPPHALLHGKMQLGFTYVFTHGDQQIRGFSGLTAGDPFVKETVRGNQPTHQLVTTASMRVWWFNVTTRLNIYSGFPFTPSVVGDINGDGMSNDRAFITNPATSTDPALAAQMAQLLAAAPPGARDCLQRQFDQIAGYNSCSSEWQARLDLNMQFVPPQTFGFGNRLRVTMNMINTSGAIVRLFGLENTALGRGALSTTVDNRLLYVTGFNPATQQFQYRVNQLFGQPINVGSSTRHYFAPFQLQLGAEFRLGGPPGAPMAQGLGLIPAGKGQAPFTPRQLRDRLRGLSRNPIDAILDLGDSLALTPEQVAQLKTISTKVRARIDTLLEPVYDYLLDKGKHADDAQLNSRLRKAQPLVTKMMADEAARARALLTPEQLKKLPASMLPTPPGGKPASGTGAKPAGAPDSDD